MMTPAILNTNGVVSTMTTFIASDPRCPAMRIFLDDEDVSRDAMEIFAPRQPYIGMIGWVKVWLRPFEIDGKPILQTRPGVVKWEPV